MNEIAKEVTIKFRWWSGVDFIDKFPQDHQERLEQAAMDHISGMIKEGFTSGELREDLWVDAVPPCKSSIFIEYLGHWEIEWRTV